MSDLMVKTPLLSDSEFVEQMKPIISLAAQANIFCLTALEIEGCDVDFDNFDEQVLREVLNNQSYRYDKKGELHDIHYRLTGEHVDNEYEQFGELQACYSENEVITQISALMACEPELSYLAATVKCCREAIEKFLDYQVTERNKVASPIILASEVMSYELTATLFGQDFTIKANQVLNERARINVVIIQEGKPDYSTAQPCINAYLKDILQDYFYGWCSLDTGRKPRG